MIRPKRGDIYLVNFDPTIGAEIRKTRPALVLQNDIANKSGPVTIVAAISSKFDDLLYPTDILLSAKARTGLAVDSVVLLNQIRTVDKKRLVKQLGRLSTARSDLRDVEPAPVRRLALNVQPAGGCGPGHFLQRVCRYCLAHSNAINGRRRHPLRASSGPLRGGGEQLGAGSGLHRGKRERTRIAPLI